MGTLCLHYHLETTVLLRVKFTAKLAVWPFQIIFMEVWKSAKFWTVKPLLISISSISCFLTFKNWLNFHCKNCLSGISHGYVGIAINSLNLGKQYLSGDVFVMYAITKFGSINSFPSFWWCSKTHLHLWMCF